MIIPFFWVILCGLMVWAMVTDWRRMEISNHCVAAVVGVGVLKLIVHLCMGGGLAVLGAQFLIALILFVAGFGLFWLGVMGGGDVKLLAALGLWLNLGQLPLFLIVMAGVGGVLGALALFLKRHAIRIPAIYAPPSWLGCLKAGQSVVAYGLAIGLGVLVVALPIILA
jgi:prepilin peptidase CpaA